MGALTSRQNAAVEEADVILNHYYRYPPRIGNYFGTHFIMGGERFDTPQPEAYLFGENADLNFLGCKPTPFPYPPPQASEPTKTLKSLVNIRKESVRFVKASDVTPKANGDGPKANVYNVEFVFDADARCTVTIHCFCSEEPGTNGLNYVPRDAMLSSETFHFKRGVNQVFSAPNYTFNPSLYSEDDLSYNAEKDTFPIVIHCVVDEGTEESRQSHTTICVVDHHSDGTYALRALKQKIYVDGLCYLLQEIYGIENKLINKTLGDEDTDDNGSECVICMCDTRDTLILPCRHLCLCNSCADSLRYQANNCPICRAPFRALLQIRAVQKNYADANPTAPHSPQEGSDNIPSGYLPISLIEALNGPVSRSKPNASDITTEHSVEPITATADKQDALNTRPKAAANHETNGSREKLNHNQVDFRMSVLLSKDDGSVACVTKDLLSKHSPLMQRAPISRDKNPREKGSLRIPSSQTNSVTVSIAEKDAKDGLAMEKETVHLVNEKSKLPELPENDDDSEAEKLSPLLQKSKEKPTDTARRLNAAMAHGKDEMNGTAQTNASSIMGLLASHDAETNVHPGAEDSDYYTPEDPHTTILSPLKGEEKLEGTKRLATPLSTLKEASQGSLPDSPVSGNSQASTRSSGDSYSSSSSTRQLLSSGVTNDTPTHVVVNLDSSEALISQDIHLSDGKKVKCLESD